MSIDQVSITPVVTSDDVSVTVLRDNNGSAVEYSIYPPANGWDFVGQNPDQGGYIYREMRPFWRFDLSNPTVFPVGSVLLSATLRIYVDGFNTSESDHLLVQARRGVWSDDPPTNEVDWGATVYNPLLESFMITGLGFKNVVTYYPTDDDVPVLGEVNCYALNHRPSMEG